MLNELEAKIKAKMAEILKDDNISMGVYRSYKSRIETKMFDIGIQELDKISIEIKNSEKNDKSKVQSTDLSKPLKNKHKDVSEDQQV